MSKRGFILLPSLIVAMAMTMAAQTPEILGIKLGDGKAAAEAAATRAFAPKPEIVNYEDDDKKPMGFWREGKSAKGQTNDSLVVGLGENGKVYYISRAGQYRFDSKDAPTAEAYVEAMKAKYGEPSVSRVREKEGGDFRWFFDENFHVLPTSQVSRQCSELPTAELLESRVTPLMRGLPKSARKGCPIMLWISYGVPFGNAAMVQAYSMILFNEPQCWLDSQAQKAAAQKQRDDEAKRGSTKRPDF